MRTNLLEKKDLSPSRRIVSLWMPSFATDRIFMQQNRGACPKNIRKNFSCVTIVKKNRKLFIDEVNTVAKSRNISSGMTLSDAQALSPDLHFQFRNSQSDSRALIHLAKWCSCYTPWVAVDGSVDHSEIGSGLWLDITGCAHLFGGEEILLDKLTDRISRIGFTSYSVVADTPGAAWAMAHFGLLPGKANHVMLSNKTRDSLGHLPVAALRISSNICFELNRLGLRQVGDLYTIPRSSIANRFGEALLNRIDQALGKVCEPISPLFEVSKFRCANTFSEPIERNEDVYGSIKELLPRICNDLENACRGVRQLELKLYLINSDTKRIRVGTYKPSRDQAYLSYLFEKRLESFDITCGIDALVLSALVTEPLVGKQLDLDKSEAQGPSDQIDSLIYRIKDRLGQRGVTRQIAFESYLPERSVVSTSLLYKKDGNLDSTVKYNNFASVDWEERNKSWFINGPRPVTLFNYPKSIKVITQPSSGLPASFHLHRILHLVLHVDGPERVEPIWWENFDNYISGLESARDYYWIEDTNGSRYWIYSITFHSGKKHAEESRVWFLHGLFA